MANKTTYVVRYRRKREGKTDYKKRLAMLKSREKRLVIRISNRHVLMQIVEYIPTGDKVLVQTNSNELKAKGWKVCNANTPEAYLTGMLMAKKAKEAKIEHVIVDTGLATHQSGGRVFAAVKGAVDGGLSIPCDESIFPSDERVNASHIASYAKTLATDNKALYEKRFSRYIKEKIDPTKINEVFEKVKQQL